MRVPAGGPATINGIIYQMLWTLLETTSIRLRNLATRVGGEEIARVTLVLEPSQGGDASILRAGVQRVVQLKARSDGSTWSLRELVHDVLPDLYGAVDSAQQQEFVFFTEGRHGDWGEVAEFFARLARYPFPEPGQSAASLLDPERMVRFRGALLNTVEGGVTTISECDLFEQIVSVLRSTRRDIKNAPEEVTRRNVWWLLSRLEFRWGETKERMRGLLFDRLHSLVDDPDATQNTLSSLLMALQDRATGGNVSIDADEFFTEHGLRGIPLVRRQWSRMVEVGAELLERDVNLKFRYDSAADVRPGGATLVAEPQVDLWRRGVEDADCLLLAGGSGQGKTWRLCALARALAATDAPVAMVTADSGARGVAEDAAHHFWSRVCFRKITTMRLDQIARHLHETGAVLPGATWLYVLVDGVQTPQEVISLYQHIGVVDGVRLAFAASERVDERLKDLPNAPPFVKLPVNDFTEEELRRYVADGDSVRWHAIRDEGVREVIQRPLLAWIYKTLAGGLGWDARNEYGLYDAYLRRQVLERLQDLGLFTASEPLIRAGLALWDGEKYPWSQKQMSIFGFGNDLIAPLLASGFLIHDDHGRYSVWHDRLKQWLTAHALAEELADGQRNVDEVGKRCHDLLFHDSRHGTPEAERELRMRYVPMDLVWQLAHRSAYSSVAAGALNALLKIFEGKQTRPRTCESLYERLLPSVGSAIAPALFRRLLETKGDREERHRRGRISRCLAGLDADAVSQDAIGLLTHADRGLRRAGVDILTSRPVATAVTTLWQLYCKLREECEIWDKRLHAERQHVSGAEIDTVRTVRQRRNREDRNPLWDKMAAWKALAACAPLAPDWIADQIRHLPAPEQINRSLPVDSLIWLLTYTRDGGELWRGSKELLRPWTVAEPGAEPGEEAVSCETAFADAAYKWRDTEEVMWLRTRVSSDHWRLLGPRCLRALARITPDVAVQALPDLAPGFFDSTDKWVLRYLLARRPDATREVMTRLITDDEKNRWGYAYVFNDVPEALTATALNILLDDIHRAIVEDDGDVYTLWKALRSIESTADIAVLQAFWRRSEQGWDEPLA
ncbi:MAG: hypothetical protein H8F28_08425, partial [Fibrella sp.]|nr:hypothetical protein [Armatimonadota bacterium]